MTVTAKEKAKRLGPIMNDLRIRAKITVAMVSARSGLSAPYLYDVFSGRYVPTIETFIKIAESMDLNVDIVLKPSENVTIHVNQEAK